MATCASTSAAVGRMAAARAKTSCGHTMLFNAVQCEAAYRHSNPHVQVRLGRCVLMIRVPSLNAVLCGE